MDGLVLIDTPEGCEFEVVVRLGAKQNKVIGVRSGALEVALVAVAADPKLSLWFLKYMSEVLHVWPGLISTIQGDKKRTRRLLVAELTGAAICERLTWPS